MTPGWQLDPDGNRLQRFREQRRRSRLGCSVAVVAVVAFWLAVGMAFQISTTSKRVGLASTLGYKHDVSTGNGAPSEGPDIGSRTDGRVLSAGTTRALRGAPLSAVTWTGTLGWADPKYGPRYLAIRERRGTVAVLCGPADCVTRVSTDFGPVLSLWNKGRLADLSASDWQRVCGLELRFGLCPGTLEIVKRPPLRLPETDVLDSGPGLPATDGL